MPTWQDLQLSGNNDPWEVVRQTPRTNAWQNLYNSGVGNNSPVIQKDNNVKTTNKIASIVPNALKSVSKHLLYDPDTKRVLPNSPFYDAPKVPNKPYKEWTKEEKDAHLEYNMGFANMVGNINWSGPIKAPLKAPAKLLVSHEGAPDAKRVKYYEKMIDEGKELEPIKVIREGAKYGIEDGKHRFQAYLNKGIKDIPIKLVEAAKKVKSQWTKGKNGRFTGSKKISNNGNVIEDILEIPNLLR